MMMMPCAAAPPVAAIGNLAMMLVRRLAAGGPERSALRHYTVARERQVGAEKAWTRRGVVCHAIRARRQAVAGPSAWLSFLPGAEAHATTALNGLFFILTDGQRWPAPAATSPPNSDRGQPRRLRTDRRRRRVSRGCCTLSRMPEAIIHR